jgi:amiloride-sensitive sodium channel
MLLHAYSFKITVFIFSRINDDFNYVNNVSFTNQHNLMAIPDHLYPLQVNELHHAVLSFKTIAPIVTKKECKFQAFCVHSPDDHPSFEERESFIEVKPGSTVEVIVTPEITKTERDLLKLDPKTRECYFENEKRLKYFKTYTMKNCELECYVNYTFKPCQCYEMQQPFGVDVPLNDSTHFCVGSVTSDFDKIFCPQLIKKELHAYENFSTEVNCSCLPTCNFVAYNTRVSVEFHDTNETVINVRMDLDNMIIYRRFQQFSVSDGISYIGGLLGLFAGISMLSIFEILYFMTLRFVTNLWRYLKD